MKRSLLPHLPWRPLVPPPSVDDHDACAIYASVRKDATPSREPVALALANLQKMLHRAGNVDGEGDGCGILVDIPRRIWAEEVRAGGHNPALAQRPGVRGRPRVHRALRRRRARRCTTPASCSAAPASGSSPSASARSSSQALGATAREEEPHFWQVGGLLAAAEDRDRDLFALARELESELGFHVPSFSATTCVYKVMGAPQVLGAYYPDLARRALRDGRLLRPQPLLDQHLAVVPPRAAVLGPRPQRRDQHDRAAAPGGARARRRRSPPAARTRRT